MRILIHTEEYLPTNLACAIRMDVFASQLRAHGHKVTVIAGSNHRSKCPEKQLPEGVIYAPTFKIRQKTTLRRMFSNLSFAVTSVLCALGAGPADVVISTSPPPLVSISGWLIAGMKRAKLVYDVRDIWPEVALEMGSFSESSIYCRIFRRITDFMYRKAHLITTVSPGKAAYLRKKLGDEKIRLIANGYDLRNDILCSAGVDTDPFGMKDTFTCVYIGNVGMAQGLETLLELAAQTCHPQARFLVYGDGAQKKTLEEEAAARGLNNIRFCGSLPHEQVASVLSRAKISYIPLKSSRMKDSIPTKLYESLAMGCPVLLAAAGDACDLLAESGLGRSVPPEDTAGIVAAFDDIAANYAQILCRREHTMSLIREKYSRQSAADLLEQDLCDLCSHKTTKKFPDT